MMSYANVIHQKPDCLVIDTNIWRSELLLKTPVGVLLVYTLGRQQGFIGLPEIIERELKKHVLESGLEAADQAQKYSRIISTLTGALSFTFSTSQEELEQIVAKRLEELLPLLK